MSMEVGTMALATFEAKFIDNVVKAMVYAIEDAIINGTGSGQPKGILAETGVVVTGALSYDKLAEVEGNVAEEYEAGAKWCMSKKTFMKFVGMVDQQGQPIARVNYGIAGKAERTVLGRDVVIAPYVAENKAFIYNFPDYILNTIYDMGISKKQDWETEDLLTKAVMSVDGKCADTGSLVVFNIEPTV
jgi:HK97 family phage major capsid protein